jgi:photosystem I reaction center subunit XII
MFHHVTNHSPLPRFDRHCELVRLRKKEFVNMPLSDVQLVAVLLVSLVPAVLAINLGSALSK